MQHCGSSESHVALNNTLAKEQRWLVRNFNDEDTRQRLGIHKKNILTRTLLVALGFSALRRSDQIVLQELQAEEDSAMVFN